MYLYKGLIQSLCHLTTWLQFSIRPDYTFRLLNAEEISRRKSDFWPLKCSQTLRRYQNLIFMSFCMQGKACKKKSGSGFDLFKHWKVIWKLKRKQQCQNSYQNVVWANSEKCQEKTPMWLHRKSHNLSVTDGWIRITNVDQGWIRRRSSYETFFHEAKS